MISSFTQLPLIQPLLKAINDVGYETPSPIQAETIPLLLEGKDVLGQAQTGTGKTAAFALPLLNHLDPKKRVTQGLILVPTRELAIQVAEALQKYAKYLKDFHISPIYGGQDYSGQIRSLQRGLHVVVGTPGRIMDHLRRGTLKLDQLSYLVLDEADEMLRMGFIDDVEWILSQAPNKRQTALFSATMPEPILKIAKKYLRNPITISIKVKSTTAETIHQRYWLVNDANKLDALTRLLEVESFEAMIVFVRTKLMAIDLAEKLAARGFSCAPLNSDVPQPQRERTINLLKKGKIDILVATDVAARGLDVDRITHVVNYDIPYDPEAYVHRIGRTGRAGRAGDAILFVTPREQRLLQTIEKATRQKIERLTLPSVEIVNEKRISRFKQRISDAITGDLALFEKIIHEYQEEYDISATTIAAGLAKLLQKETPLLLKPGTEPEFSEDKKSSKKSKRSTKERTATDDYDSYRIAVGHSHEVKPAQIIAAICNSSGIESKNIGHIKIHDDFSEIELPKNMPTNIFNDLKKVWVAGQQLKISPIIARKKPSSFKKPDRKPTKKNQRG